MMAKLLTLSAALLLLGSIPKEEAGELIEQAPLDGSWELVSITSDSRTLLHTGYVLQVAKAKITWLHRGNSAGIQQDFLPSTDGQARFTWAGLHGIYAVNGNTLTLAMTLANDPWPQGFDAKTGAKYIYLLKRAKK